MKFKYGNNIQPRLTTSIIFTKYASRRSTTPYTTLWPSSISPAVLRHCADVVRDIFIIIISSLRELSHYMKNRLYIFFAKICKWYGLWCQFHAGLRQKPHGVLMMIFFCVPWWTIYGWQMMREINLQVRRWALFYKSVQDLLNDLVSNWSLAWTMLLLQMLSCHQKYIN